MPIIYLLRHAQSVANVEGILAGQDDSVDLSKQGFQESKKLIAHLESLKISQVFCSPLRRCVQTITPFMNSNPNMEFLIEPNLIEMDYGQWSGRKLNSLAKDRRWKVIQNKPSTFTFPDGESFKQMRKRVEKVISVSNSYKDPILMVSHGDVIKMFLATAMNLPIDRFQSFLIEPASISAVSVNKNRNTILRTNYRMTASELKIFKSNQLGGGNSFGKASRWWRK